MDRRGLVALGAGAVVGIGLAACSPQSSDGVLGMRLTSSAFGEGGSIPETYTCDGEDVSPPLAWDEPPEGTAGFALIVTDPDAGGFVHWVLTDIPADVRSLAEGQGDSAGTPGRNGFGGIGWGGPCPPGGEHRYVFELLAVSEPMRNVGDPPAADRVRSVANGATLARAELIGVYRRR